MRSEPLRIHASAVLLVVLVLTCSGCLNLRPVADTSRYFLLTPHPAASAGTFSGPAVGIGRVEMPEYLQFKGIALRRSNNEILYSDTLQWAERLDKGIQRVIDANLGALLGATNVLLSPWRRSDVRAEVYVAVQRFETDEHGRAVLEAHWRVTTPGAETTLRADTSRISRQGPRLAENPDAATAALSETLNELSREIAIAISETTHKTHEHEPHLPHGFGTSGP